MNETYTGVHVIHNYVVMVVVYVLYYGIVILCVMWSNMQGLDCQLYARSYLYFVTSYSVHCTVMEVQWPTTRCHGSSGSIMGVA